MQDLLLVAVVGAAFLFGWFLVKKLDAIPESSRQDRPSPVFPGTKSLRIGLSNPLAADSLSGIFESYSKLQPNVPVRLFSGTGEELVKALVTQQLDVIFLPRRADILSDDRLRVREVVLTHTPVLMQSGGCPIQPIADGDILQEAVWRTDTQSECLKDFLVCLQEELPRLSPEKMESVDTV